MKPFSFKIEVDEEVLKERNECIQYLKNDELLAMLCQKSNIDFSLVETYPYKFKQWLTNVKACQTCLGLSECKQKNIGKVYHLRNDGCLDFILQSCRYARLQEKEEMHLKSFAVNDMPSILYQAKLSQLDVTADNLEAISKISDWLENPSNTGFYLHGKMGVGKTTLACCACNYFARKDKWVAFVNIPEWVARMKNLINSPDEYRSQIKMLQNVDFLVMDDIGEESATSWVRDELLFPILNRRMEEKRMTWCTSNDDFKSLQEHYTFSAKYGEEKLKALRIMERITTLCKEIVIKGENRRKQEV